MSWGAIGASVAGAVVGGVMGGGDSESGQTMSKEPWAPARPWLEQNIQTGQDLQRYYQANPFNQIQQSAYGSLLGGNDYINQMVPGLLGQFGQQQGFDRANPRQRPQAYQFPPMQGMGMGGQGAAPMGGGGMQGGLLGNMNQTQNPFANGMMPPAPPPPPPAPAPAGPYVNYNDVMSWGAV